MTTIAKLSHIEVLRGIAVILVLLFHLQVPGFENGYLGVDLFFVISGFLMAKIYGDITTKAQIVDFFIRRCRRLLPAYFVVMLTTSVMAVLIFLPHEIEQTLEQGVWSAFLLPNFGLWNLRSYFDYMQLKPLLNFWSLGVELQFYLLFPLLLALARYSNRYFNFFIVFSLLIAFVSSFVDPKSGFFLLHARFWEFMAGFLIAKHMQTSQPSSIGRGSISTLALVAFIVGSSQLPIDNSFLLILIAVLCSMGAVAWGFQFSTPLAIVEKAFIGLGKYSYSIYLVHFPVIVFVNYQPFEGTHLQVQSISDLVLVLFLTACLSMLLFHGVEKSARLKLSGSGLVASFVVVAMLSSLLIGPAIAIGKYRLDDDVRLIANALDDRGVYQCEGALTDTILSKSCILAGDADSSGDHFILSGNSHADGVKEAFAQVLLENSHIAHMMKDYAAVGEKFTGDSVVNEAVEQGIEHIVLHSTKQADDGVALAHFIENAFQHGISVFYIAAVPLYDFSIPKRMLENLTEKGEALRVGMPLQQHVDYVAQLHKNLNQYQTDYSNFQWFDPTRYFCEDYCYIANEAGVPLYYDTNHLTLTGASLLKPIFQQISGKQLEVGE